MQDTDHDLPIDSPKGAPSNTGTDGLDLDVQEGTITLIAGPMGCGKTTLCKQFLSHGDADPKRRVLVSFDIPNRGLNEEEKGVENKFTLLSFTQSHFDLNVLVAHINWILEHACERLAFDGLSEWITKFEKPEAARVLEALMVTVKLSRPDKPVPSVFMTYELPLDDDPLGPAALGAGADNLVVVRKVPVNDELRKVIYVLKQKGGPKDDNEPTHQHPSELVWNKNNGLSVNSTSLEAFTGLLSPSRNVEPARVLIQLFAENKAEMDFNHSLEKQLEDHFAQRLRLTFSRFSVSEIGSTIEVSFGIGNLGDAFYLSIHSVDEWWLKAGKIRKALRNLRASERPGGLNHRDFWWFEMEKSLESQADKKPDIWCAVPGYMDFGMFCVNPGAMAMAYRQKHGLTSDAVLRTKPFMWERHQWEQVLSAVPRLWILNKGEWFDIGPTDKPVTVLAFALKATGQTDPRPRENLRRKAVFTFDASTRDTCSCMYFELAWAFGASPSFLADGKGSNRTAATQAMRFLQFMVLEGLMPARSSVNSHNHNDQPILFSRHWYSTLRRCEEERDLKEQASARPPRDPGGLMALPFMPTALEGDQSIENLLEDIMVRQYHWLRRAWAYSEQRFGPRLFRSHYDSLLITCEALKTSASLLDKVALAIEAYVHSRKWLLDMVNSPDSGTSTDESSWTADMDDLIEIAGWAALRLQLMFGRNRGSFPSRLRPGLQANGAQEDPAARALFEARWVRHSLPDLSTLSVKGFQAANAVATGYACSGSWMYGVHHESRSSEIQAQILTELTSLENAERRTEAGAGMPARKDFFYLKGEKAVTGMEYLNWRELLRFTGSRARRRDRVLSDPLLQPASDAPYLAATDDPSELYATIHVELLACLRIADLHRQEYASGNDKDRQIAIKQVSARAVMAVDAIYRCAQNTR